MKRSRLTREENGLWSSSFFGNFADAGYDDCILDHLFTEGCDYNGTDETMDMLPKDNVFSVYQEWNNDKGRKKRMNAIQRVVNMLAPYRMSRSAVKTICDVAAVIIENNITIRVETAKNGMKEKKKVFEPAFSPKFEFVTMKFNGKPPFKKEAIIDLRDIIMDKSSIQRQIGTVLNELLLRTLEDHNAHRYLTLLKIPKANKKNRNFQEMDLAVQYWFLDFMCLSFGFPKHLRYPTYTYEDLRAENLNLAARIGRTEEEGKENFGKLIEDVNNFARLVKDKLQRIL
ncbi:unnamed protein product [Caenorhabditis bovis]|uniref:Uncharacterized protein n=1 Tax=Caenorhabditis bovis TaxID=2654633 RepID=A0A8S1EB22_9PELO|nr:unnamed protein product [Caenorhabditis bovis]